jgi:hypothetical protein
LPLGPSIGEAQKAQITEAPERMLSGVDGDGLLFLGKAETLTRTPMEPSIYLDLAYRKEIGRRQKIAFGEFLTDATVEDNLVSPNDIHPR